MSSSTSPVGESPKAVPRIFLSYSHDSRAHKQWVSEFAGWLRTKGVDVVLDQWELGPGDDVTLFMEGAITDCDRVLAVCSDEYVRKANAGHGGVGYERMIVTAELVRSVGTNKFIPIVRNSAAGDSVPRFLQTRFHVNLSDDCADLEAQRTVLLRELHRVPPERPPLGKNPFAAPDSLQPTTAVSIAAIPAPTASPSQMYRAAEEVIRRPDLMGWRQLSKRTSGQFAPALSDWRRQHEANHPRTESELLAAVDEAVAMVAPRVVLALAGVESSTAAFKDQRAVFDDLYNISGWNRSGTTTLAELPDALGYVYQSLHGALCWDTVQVELAFLLSDMELRAPDGGSVYRLRDQKALMGWPSSLGRSCTATWRFIYSAADRWTWLGEIFGSDERYQVALVSYYLALALDEFAESTRTAELREIMRSNTRTFSFDIPLTFTEAPYDVISKSVEAVRRQLPLLRDRWALSGVDVKLLPSLWPSWLRASYSWLSATYPNRAHTIPYSSIFDK